MPRWLLRDGEVIPDEWRTPNEAAPGDDLLLTFAEWSAEREQWLARPGLTVFPLLAGSEEKLEDLKVAPFERTTDVTAASTPKSVAK